jgi:hypothetical protein
MSAGLVFDLKKSKRCCFSKTKKTKVNRFATGSYRVAGSTRRVSRVTPGFSFPCFSSTWSDFSPRSAGFRIDPPDWVSKLCFETRLERYIYHLLLLLT